MAGATLRRPADRSGGGHTVSKDDDNTPPRGGRRTHWSDDDRASVGSERRQRLRSYPRGVPAAVSPDANDDTDETTSPFALLEREPDADELELIRRSRYEAGDPVPMREFAKALRRLDKLVRDEKSNNRERANQLLDLLNRPPNELTAKLQETVIELRADMSKIKEVVATVRKALLWVALAAIGSLGTVGGFLYFRGFGEGESKIRLDHIEKSIDELRTDLRSSSHWSKGPIP